MAKATFAAGCFWHVEEAFRTMPGVMKTTVGYMGGTLVNPTYEDVCTDETGHAEVVEVEFDPVKVRYEDLLEKFWKIHDPTSLNRQGPDEGTQYRSAIFTHDPEQKQVAQESAQKLQQKLSKPIVTEIMTAGPFYRAEEYHQQYLAKRGRTSCEV